jgi:hypothetical protein
MKLAELQQLFAAMAGGGAPPSRLVAELETDGLERGLALYARSSQTKMMAAVARRFGHVSKHLGADAFAELISELRRQQPLHAHTQEALEQLLPGFLDQLTARLGRPDLGDLARLEAARCTVSEAADAEACTEAQFLREVGASWASARLDFVPALQVLRTRHDVAELWAAIDTGGEVPRPTSGSVSWLVWRQNLVVYHSQLEPPEAAALGIALTGAPLEAICEAFAGEPEPARAACEMVRRWLGDGLVAAVLSLAGHATPAGGRLAPSLPRMVPGDLMESRPRGTHP